MQDQESSTVAGSVIINLLALIQINKIRRANLKLINLKRNKETKAVYKDDS